MTGDDMIPKDDNIKCGNGLCDIKMTCGVYSDRLPNDPVEVFNYGKPDGATCRHFSVRRALGGDGNEDIVHTESRRGRGRRHNAHVPPRESFSASSELFGIDLGKRPKRGRAPRGVQHDPLVLPPRPDLMVTRHIHKGKDINQQED